MLKSVTLPRAVALALTASLLLAGCGSAVPLVEVEAEPDINLFGQTYFRIKIKSLADDITVQAVQVNRGNCKPLSEVRARTLRFGQSTLVTLPESCEPTQVDVTTDKGGWSFSF